METKYIKGVCNMVDACCMISQYSDLLDIDNIYISLNSYSVIKIDFADVKHIEIINEEYMNFITFFGNISVKIEDIDYIEIE